MTILLETVHTVKPLTSTAFDRYVEAYGELVIPAFERHGYDLLGAWKRTGGEMGQDVLLIRFENLGAMERASASLFKDRKMLDSLGVALGSAGIQLSESAKAAVPVPYATEQRLEQALREQPAAPRQYLQAILQLTLGGQAAAYDVLGKLADWGAANSAFQLVTAYETTIGQRGELTDLWILPQGLGSFDYTPGDPMAEMVAPLRKVAPEESIYYLNPLPYSPLQ